MNVDRIALQLYTVRDRLAADPGETLRAVARMGYGHVELAGTAGLPAERFRDLLDDVGLRALGAHVAIERLADRTEAAFDEAETLGYPLLIVPSLAPALQGGFSAGARVGERLGKLAVRAQVRGLRIGYHNHTFEFQGRPGDRLWDGLVATAPPEVRLEVDVCWAQVAGEDPVALLDALSGRVGSLHLKDVAEDGRSPRIPGAGTLPWQAIVDAGDRNGVEWFVVEEDDPADALEAAATGYGFVRRLATAPSRSS